MIMNIRLLQHTTYSISLALTYVYIFRFEMVFVLLNITTI
jgi:hypothetical protein